MLIGLAACFGPTQYTPDEAERIAHRRAEKAYEGLVPPPNYAASALAQLLIQRDLEIMRVEGERSGTEPGVTVVVRVRQWLDKQGDRATPGDDRYFCFRMHFGEIHQEHPVESVDCPATAPLDYPTIEPAPRLPDEQTVREDLMGVAPDETAVRSALGRLDLDPRIIVDVRTKNGAVGVGLRSRDSIGERAGCLLIRVDDASLEVWTLLPRLDVPGEASCDGFGALARDGQRLPH